ncbi:uncharacterized protein ARMOST_01306 [Armillaria ostoyae]|uniref:Uncharacterized protein n=1 Tax=Armillaria ostoyae TaxID=47428 RepID=A0A284QNS9_ARMOS|nr:uncharacterized protein ARMOST_01306 [Armillaria ostoyae]
MRRLGMKYERHHGIDAAVKPLGAPGWTVIEIHFGNNRELDFWKFDPPIMTAFLQFEFSSFREGRIALFSSMIDRSALDKGLRLPGGQVIALKVQERRNPSCINGAQCSRCFIRGRCVERKGFKFSTDAVDVSDYDSDVVLHQQLERLDDAAVSPACTVNLNVVRRCTFCLRREFTNPNPSTSRKLDCLEAFHVPSRPGVATFAVPLRSRVPVQFRCYGITLLPEKRNCQASYTGQQIPASLLNMMA